MKVLFVCKSKKIEVLGLMYLSAVVKQCGHDAKIVDVNEAMYQAANWKPDVIGFSVMTGDQKQMAMLNRKIKGPSISIFGGPHATFFPQEFINDVKIDYVVEGEAEDFMSRFLECDKSFPDIDSLPWPDRTDFPNMKIRDFLSSRGCNYDCGYCYNSSWKKLFPEIPHIRIRNVSDVIAEVTAVNPYFVYWQDSCFGTNIKWLREFSLEYRRKVNIPYHAHLRPKQANEERVLLLHDSNCVSVKVALETASDRLRKLINRGNTNNEDALTAARLLKKWDIKLIMQNILALPTATIEDDLATLEINIRCKPAYAWSSIFQPYPSTELAKICEKEGYYTGNYSEIGDNFFDKSVLNISDKHKEQVACLQRIFAFCVEMQIMPKITDLTWETLPKFIHTAMRKIGDKRMFPGIVI